MSIQQPNNNRLFFGFAFILIALLVLGMFTGLIAGNNSIRLIGYGCEGASAPLYAKEESDFPKCKRIERRGLFQ